MAKKRTHRVVVSTTRLVIGLIPVLIASVSFVLALISNASYSGCSAGGWLYSAWAFGLAAIGLSAWGIFDSFKYKSRLLIAGGVAVLLGVLVLGIFAYLVAYICIAPV
jgi:hypothetical protein